MYANLCFAQIAVLGHAMTMNRMLKGETDSELSGLKMIGRAENVTVLEWECLSNLHPSLP